MMDRIEFPEKKTSPPTGISAPSKAHISAGDGGDEIVLLDDNGNERLVFKGLKTYKKMGSKWVLWDIDKNASKKEEE